MQWPRFDICFTGYRYFFLPFFGFISVYHLTLKYKTQFHDWFYFIDIGGSVREPVISVTQVVLQIQGNVMYL